MRKTLRKRELFAVEGEAETVLTTTLRRVTGDLPVIFDELNGALEAHDAEEYGRIAGAMRALFARHGDKEERSFIGWRKRGEPA